MWIVPPELVPALEASVGKPEIYGEPVEIVFHSHDIYEVGVQRGVLTQEQADTMRSQDAMYDELVRRGDISKFTAWKLKAARDKSLFAKETP